MPRRRSQRLNRESRYQADMATFFANRAIETAQAAKAAEAEEAQAGGEYAGEFWFSSSKKSEAAPAPAPSATGLSASTQAILAALHESKQSKFKGSMATGGSRYSAHATLMNTFASSFRQVCASGEC